MYLIKISLALVIAIWPSFSAAVNNDIGTSLHKKESLKIQDIPPRAVQLVKALAPELKIEGAEKEYKHKNTYIDIEGALLDGREIEFDLLKKGNTWEVVEIQRDLLLTQVPKNVVKALKADAPNFKPLRIIESVQYGKKMTIYEFYTRETSGLESRKEVKLEDGIASVLVHDWQH